MQQDKDYILGTHDEEIARLGLQHRVWRPRALAAWRNAGFTVGQTLLDLGCGPGFAAMDLAEIVGPAGKILAMDRSRRFLNALEAAREQRGLRQIETRELDLDAAAWPPLQADGAWARWVFAFVKQPRALLGRVAGALKRGGVLVLHEYFDYSTWRLAPRLPELEEFVQTVMQSWRADGGEPDIGLELPRWLAELGFEIKSMRPLIDLVPASNFVWQWPKAFLEVGLARLVDLGYLPKARAREIWDAFITREASPETLMITPAVLEIVAVRR